MTPRLLTLAAACALATTLVVPAGSASAATQTNEGRFHQTAAARLLDTRLTGGPVAKDGSVTVPVAGRSGVPAVGAKAVVVNITAVNTTDQGWITAYASGTARPNTSAVNFPARWTGATTATVAVGADGSIKLDVRNAGADVLVDLVGYYSTAADTSPLGSLVVVGDGYRLTDTRTGTGPVAGRATLEQTVALGATQVPARPTAVAINLTAVDPQGDGYLTAYDGGTLPATSSLNFVTGRNVANYTVVPVRDLGDGTYGFSVRNGSAKSVDVLVDVLGFYYENDQGLGYTFKQLDPSRVLDTRIGLGAPKAKLDADTVLATTPPASMFEQYTLGLAGTITGVDPTADTYLTQYSGFGRDPGTSNLNLVGGEPQLSNGFGAAAWIDSSSGKRTLNIYNQNGKVHVVEDVTGRFDPTAELIAAFEAGTLSPKAGPKMTIHAGPARVTR